MGERRWEDLPTDCLVDVFGRVGLESLIDGVPFVCKSWHRVTLIPHCWRQLVFTKLPYPRGSDPSVTRLNPKKKRKRICSLETFRSLETFIKDVIGRSDGLATKIAFPSSYGAFTETMMNCVGKE